MRRERYFLVLFVVGGLMFQSCEKSDDNVKVESSIEKVFKAQYPGVTQVSWKNEGQYHVADFMHPDLSVGCEAWYENSGLWLMTETDIPYEMLPDQVKVELKRSSYANWRIDDVDMLERREMEEVYVLEIEKGGKQYDLFYAEDGTLVKVSPNRIYDSRSYLPATLPASVCEYINLHYPQSKVLEVEAGSDGVRVDILDGITHRELMFGTAREWQYTKTEKRKADLPQNVINAFAKSEYSSYTVRSVSFYDTPGKDYYLFELESGGTEAEFKFVVERLSGFI